MAAAGENLGFPTSGWSGFGFVVELQRRDRDYCKITVEHDVAIDAMGEERTRVSVGDARKAELPRNEQRRPAFSASLQYHAMNHENG